MANTFIVYPNETGSTTDYAVPFEYLSTAYVKATVDGVDAPFTFLSTHMIRFLDAPVGRLMIYRETDTPELLNEYSDGSVLIDDDLNASFLQGLHVSEEAAERSLRLHFDGTYTAGGLRLSQLADPVDSLDAANKNYVDTRLAADMADIEADRIAAETARDGAEVILQETEGVLQETEGVLQETEGVLQDAEYVLGQTEEVLTEATGVLDEAEAARDVVLQGLSTVISPKATVALAEADDPSVDPDYYQTTYFDTDYKPRSGMLWLKQPSEPTIGAKFQNQNGTWYLPGGTPIHPESVGPVGTMADDTASFLKAVEVAKNVDGAYVMLATHPYQIDENVVMDGADNVFVVGEDPQRSVLEFAPDRTGYMLSWYDETRTVHGGGLLGLTLRGNPALASGGNAGVRFGADYGGSALYYHADGWVTRDLFIKSFAQYGMGVYSGSNWDCWVDISDHGFIAQDPGSCMGFFVFPHDTTNKSRGGVIRSLYSRISDASMANETNSAAFKLQTHEDLHVQYAYAEGGSEECVSLDSPNRLLLDHLDIVMTQKIARFASRAGLIFQSRSPAHDFVAERADVGTVTIRKRDAEVTAINGVLLAADQPNATEHRTDNWHFGQIYMPDLNLRQNDRAAMQNSTFRRIDCSRFSVGGIVSNVTPSENLRHRNNHFGTVRILSITSGYDGDDTTFEKIIHGNPNASDVVLFQMYGDDNRVLDFSSRGSSGGALNLYSKRAKIYGPSFEPRSGRTVIFQPGSEDNQIINPVGIRNGTGVEYAGGTGNVIINPENHHELAGNPASGDIFWSIAGNVYERDIPMTEDRTTTISNTGMPDGATWDFIRTGGDTGGPWTWTLEDESSNVLATLSEGQGCRISKVNGTLRRIASWSV